MQVYSIITVGFYWKEPFDVEAGTVAVNPLYFFQHAHFILIVGVRKERRILIGPW